MNLENNSSDSEANEASNYRRSRRSRRKRKQQEQQERYSFESDSESGKDFSPDSGDDRTYVLPKRNLPTTSRGRPRGINAYRATHGMTWNIQTIPTSDAPSALPVIRGGSRGRSRRRGSSRREMLAEHRQLVENLEEEDIEQGLHAEIRSPTPKLPPLNDGNVNLLCFEIFSHHNLSIHGNFC